MKTKLISLITIVLLTLTACQEPVAEEKVEAPDYATFNNKVETLRSFLKAHSDENLDAQSNMMADTLKWSPPAYNGNKWLGKEEMLTALKGYHDNFENIKYTEGIALQDSIVNGVYAGSVFPKASATTDPNAIRLYGTWHAKHSESGKDIGVKWYAIGWVNEAGKIAQWTEYFDVNGLAVQIAEE
jgi:limonene-1,2-epoxide hydrolase